MRLVVDKKAVAEELDKIAAFMELKGENPFRVRAFRSAARTVKGLPKSIETALEDGSLASTRGIGPSTLQVIHDVMASGRSQLLEDLRGQVPPGLVDMLAISGLGVARIRQIHSTLGIETLPELEVAALDGRLAKLPRFGHRTASNIAKAIAYLQRSREFKLVHHATDEAERLVGALGRMPRVTAAIVAGDLRRRCELVRDLVVLLIADATPADVFQRLSQLPGIQEFASRDERRVTVQFAGGGTATIVVTTPVNAGTVLVQVTGSPEHLAQVESHARSLGYTTSGAALWRGSTFVPTPDEQTFYRALGLELIPPELREGSDEITAAETGGLPSLVEAGDLRGVLHCHTPDSDGSSSIEELALAAREAGYEYLGVSDHSHSAAYAGGLSATDLRRQGDEIDAVNAAVSGIRVLKGVESDILPDGALDYDAATLDTLDFVIASIHNRLTMPKDEMTARLLTAIDNPYVTIIGHPTGRLLLARSAYEVDLDRVFEKAATSGVAIEINADPHRLDLDWRVLRRARDLGVVIAIGADAHNAAGLSNVSFGVGVARKGWLTRKHVLNTQSCGEFIAFAQDRRNP
ncbi:MAG: DNA polymerase/3'-5' exonuclease PolX [Gemmatimonadales bacterium]|nr:DNA polymerase/3'-5' exonuclease PolX [Gemmatimonadales bacterium]